MAVESSLLWNEIGLGKNPSSALTGPVTLHKLLNLFKQDPVFLMWMMGLMMLSSEDW